MKNYLTLLLSILLPTACTTKENDFRNAVKSICIPDLENSVSELGSDRFMGRKPFTEGEEITVNYLAEQLRLIGFKPAFNNSYFQQVPMVEICSSINGAAITKSSKTISTISTPDEAAIISPIRDKEIRVSNSEIVFAGFGIVAPEYGWNDYAGLDVKGKTVIVMINDPGLYSGDSSVFKGREMTYYGRWTYKYEEAARQGAEGILIIHETEGAGYTYAVPRNSAITSRFYLQNNEDSKNLCRFTGWLSAQTADKLFTSCGLNVAKLRSDASKKGFRGFPLSMEISLTIRNSIRYDNSRNVGGILKGNKRPDECIVYTAHWDHFGIGEPENGDSIFNGAVDNGTSMAWALAIGKAFSQLKQKPDRSVILLFPTSEEQGLIGSVCYTENPALPMEKTVACINNDLLLPIGRMKDVMITGYGQSELDDYVEKAASLQDRYVVNDPNYHTGMYFRSDHFAFAAKGVPSLYARGNIDNRKFGKEWTAAKEKEYIENRYHRPTDNYDPGNWNFEGIAEDAALAFKIGYDLTTSDYFPEWTDKSEFKLLRNK